MKALSIQQPWAWALLHAGKDVENRDWQPNNPALHDAKALVRKRARVLIHTGQRFDDEGYDYLRLRCGPSIPWRGDMQRGGIVGVARLIGIIHGDDFEHFPDALVTVAQGSPWFSASLGLVFTDRRPLSFVKLKGALGFFDVADELVPEALAE